MTAAIVTSDLDGRMWMNDAAIDMFMAPMSTPVIPPEDWSAAFHVFDPRTRMPVAPDMTPANRALREGVVHTELLVAPPDGQERIVDVTARPIDGPSGDVIGVMVCCHDVTADWHERVGAVGFDVDYFNMLCPCAAWQVEAPVGTPTIWIEETVLEHMQECVILAATRMTAMAGSSNI